MIYHSEENKNKYLSKLKSLTRVGSINYAASPLAFFMQYKPAEKLPFLGRINKDTFNITLSGRSLANYYYLKGEVIEQEGKTKIIISTQLILWFKILIPFVYLGLLAFPVLYFIHSEGIYGASKILLFSQAAIFISMALLHQNKRKLIKRFEEKTASSYKK
ncbi:MAG: hypothetical protein R3206_08860 [Salegentibacter mishustinae]|nr:hypothetical protein [Salegentibacter mishustinae]